MSMPPFNYFETETNLEGSSFRAIVSKASVEKKLSENKLNLKNFKKYWIENNDDFYLDFILLEEKYPSYQKEYEAIILENTYSENGTQFKETTKIKAFDLVSLQTMYAQPMFSGFGFRHILNNSDMPDSTVTLEKIEVLQICYLKTLLKDYPLAKEYLHQKNMNLIETELENLIENLEDLKHSQKLILQYSKEKLFVILSFCGGIGYFLPSTFSIPTIAILLVSYSTKITTNSTKYYLVTKDLKNIEKIISDKREKLYGRWAHFPNPIYGDKFVNGIKSILQGSLKNMWELSKTINKEKEFIFDASTFTKLNSSIDHPVPLLKVSFWMSTITICLHTHYYQTPYDSFNLGTVIKQWTYSHKSLKDTF
jgi:hypothetical protein